MTGLPMQRRADEVHVVLDEAEGVAALAVELEDGVADGAEERAVDAGADLVEEDDLGVDHHGAAELEELLLAAGEVAGELVGHVADLEELDHLVGLGADLGLARADAAALEPGVPEHLAGLVGGDHHQVLAHGEGGELVGDLEGAQEALVEERVRAEAGDLLAVEPDPAGGGREEAGDDVEEGGLAGAVRADQAGDRALGDRDRDPVDGADAAEMHVEVLDTDHPAPPGSGRPRAGAGRVGDQRYSSVERRCP